MTKATKYVNKRNGASCFLIGVAANADGQTTVEVVDHAGESHRIQLASFLVNYTTEGGQ